MSPSTRDRPLLLRARADVAAAAARVAGSPRWVVTDPVTLAHYDLSEQEYMLLGELGERSSLRDLQRAFERRFAPRRISLEEVWYFLSRLHNAGLVVSAGHGQGERLFEKHTKAQRERAAWAWTRLLAIKLPGVNPDRFMDATYPLVRPLMGPVAVAAAVALCCYALSIVLVDYAQFVAGMPGLASLATPGNLAALAVTALAVKVLHELGHAYACRRFGGRVHEMGVLLLAFAPALYCDVSDLWRLPSKRKRMLVSAAGILVELVLAALAVVVWRYSEPGLLRLAALDVMIVCTVGTLVVNANPLLRYDGYYLLSDLTETPNLWQRSRESVHSLVGDWTTLRDQPRPPIKPWWLPVYGLASQIYMVVVLVSIVWVLALTLRPYRLDALAWGAGAVALAAAVVSPARGLLRWRLNPLATRRLRRGRAAGLVLLAALLLAALAQFPLRFSVQGDAVVALESEAVVVTTIAGRIEHARRPGERVRAGEVVARLVNPDLQRDLLRLEGRVAEAQSSVQQLKARRARDKQANDELPVAEAELADLASRLQSMRAEADRLLLRAPRAGVIIAPAARPPEPPHSLTLASWCGTPLDVENRGAWLAPGVELCRVGDPADLSGRVSLDEDDIERVRPGQRVRLAWRQSPGVVSHGHVREVSQRVIMDRGAQGGHAAVRRHYDAVVSLDDLSAPLLVDGVGKARIDTGGTTLGALLVTRVRQWFRLP